MNNGTYIFNDKNEDLTITYFIRPGNEKTLLYLHGGACSSEDFLEATKREELNSYRIVRFDFPGCGESSCPVNKSLDIEDLIEITRDIIKRLNLHNIILIGHSTGGLVALKYIVKYGGIDAFINVEGNLASENCVFSRKIATSKSYDEYKYKLWPALQTNLKNSKNRGFQKWAKTQQKASPKAFYDYCNWVVKYCDDPSTFKEYLNLKISHLYIYGSENKENLAFLKKLESEGSTVVEISKSNHFPFYDNPDEFYKVIENFIATV